MSEKPPFRITFTPSEHAQVEHKDIADRTLYEDGLKAMLEHLVALGYYHAGESAHIVFPTPDTIKEWEPHKHGKAIARCILTAEIKHMAPGTKAVDRIYDALTAEGHFVDVYPDIMASTKEFEVVEYSVYEKKA
jgi:hypothetical protein